MLDREIARQALAFPGFGRLLTIPGVDVGTAAAVVAAVGDVTRFPSAGQLVAYLGLDRRSASPGQSPLATGTVKARGPAGPLDARRGRMDLDPQPRTAQSVRGARPRASRRTDRGGRCRAQARRAVLESAHQGPGLRVRTPLTDTTEDPPPRTRRWAPQLPRGRKKGAPVSGASSSQRAAERELQHQAELAYRRLIADWRTTAPKGGAGATPGRASNKPTRGKAARQATSPDACTSLRQSPAPPPDHPTPTRPAPPPDAAAHRTPRHAPKPLSPPHPPELPTARQTRCTPHPGHTQRCAPAACPKPPPGPPRASKPLPVDTRISQEDFDEPLDFSSADAQ